SLPPFRDALGVPGGLLSFLGPKVPAPGPVPLGAGTLELSGSIGLRPGSSDEDPRDSGAMAGGGVPTPGEVEAGISDAGSAGATTVDPVLKGDVGATVVGQPALGAK